MVSKMELVQHAPREEPRFGRVVHMLKFYPNLTPLVDHYGRPVALHGLFARELIDYLNTHAHEGRYSTEGSRASSSMSSIALNGKRVIMINQQSLYRLLLVVSRSELNDHIAHFLKEQYPIRKFVWVEVS